MMNKQMMNMEELEQVTGGNIFTDAWDWLCNKLTGGPEARRDYTHANCGGKIKNEDHGVYHPDVWLTCSKCGKTWHPHNPNNIKNCEDLIPV